MAAEQPTHTPIRLRDPEGWWLYAAAGELPVRRLVVFVHGFMGSATDTWSDFPAAGRDRPWWREADLLFVGYKSTREVIAGVANRLLERLDDFYPEPHDAIRNTMGHPARESVDRYSGLVVLGHSLGGVVIRSALANAATDWKRDQASRHPLLDAQVCLFSPATGGFAPSGILGVLKSSSRWRMIEMIARSAPAYQDLKPESLALAELKELTEGWAMESGCEALRPRIVFAQPDRVVRTSWYRTDFRARTWDGTSHASVCKPKPEQFAAPWDFVEGSVRDVQQS